MSLTLLDTDVASYIIKRRPAALADRFEQSARELCVSVITVAELRFGYAKRGAGGALENLVEDFLSRLTILDWTDAETWHYALLRKAVEVKGTPVAAMDLLIAAHAVSRKAVLITNNRRHFEVIPGLALDVWPELEAV